MKKLLALTLATLSAGSVFAQADAPAGNTNRGSEMRHMFTFDADSVLQGVYSLDRSKRKGAGADNDSELNLNLNYFYALENMPRLQLGGGLNYLKDTNYNGDVENYGFRVGAIYNLSDNLTQSIYGKALVGMDWNQEYGGGTGSTDDEVLNLTLAVGKRFSLSRWGLNHVVYTPEVAYTKSDSTTGSDVDYTSALELRFLQFAVFF